MGKYISGKVTCTIEFDSVYIENGENEIDAIFPDGWEGEMTSDNLEIYDKVEEKN